MSDEIPMPKFGTKIEVTVTWELTKCVDLDTQRAYTFSLRTPKGRTGPSFTPLVVEMRVDHTWLREPDNASTPDGELPARLLVGIKTACEMNVFDYIDAGIKAVIALNAQKPDPRVVDADQPPKTDEVKPITCVPSRAAYEAMRSRLGRNALDTEADYLVAGLCAKTLECGSLCCLAAGHDGGCECCGDDPGKPGTCPA